MLRTSKIGRPAFTIVANCFENISISSVFTFFLQNENPFPFIVLAITATGLFWFLIEENVYYFAFESSQSGFLDGESTYDFYILLQPIILEKNIKIMELVE